MFRTTIRRNVGTRLLSAALAAAVSDSGGCATLAHRNSHSYEGKEKVSSCARGEGVCPWLIGDALLLIPGILPGVIAFIVDFGTGAWHHDNLSGEVQTGSAQEPASPPSDG